MAQNSKKKKKKKKKNYEKKTQILRKKLRLDSNDAEYQAYSGNTACSTPFGGQPPSLHSATFFHQGYMNCIGKRTLFHSSNCGCVWPNVLHLYFMIETRQKKTEEKKHP